MQKHPTEFGITPQEFETFLERGQIKNIASKQLLFTEGQICKSWIYVKSGITRHFVVTREGKDITKNFTASNNFLFYSLSSFINKKPGYIQVETLTDCEIVTWSASDFQYYFQQSDWQQFYLHLLENFCLKKEEKEVAFLKDDAETRYRDFLSKNGKLLNLIPHHYIASNIGISPETLSRVRKKIFLT